jgi:hypothetical protein
LESDHQNDHPGCFVCLSPLSDGEICTVKHVGSLVLIFFLIKETGSGLSSLEELPATNNTTRLAASYRHTPSTWNILKTLPDKRPRFNSLNNSTLIHDMLQSVQPDLFTIPKATISSKRQTFFKTVMSWTLEKMDQLLIQNVSLKITCSIDLDFAL